MKEKPVKAPRSWKAKRNCPRCGGLPDAFTELYQDTTATFKAVDGIPGQEGLWDFGTPYGVRARCGSCGNEWRLKGFQSIQQLKP